MGREAPEFSVVELVTGLLMALRILGVQKIVLDRATQEAVVHATEGFTPQLEAEGYWISYYLVVNQLYGGSSTVADAFRAPSTILWLKRWTGERAVDIDATESMAEDVLATMPGPRSRWLNLAQRFLSEREKLS